MGDELLPGLRRERGDVDAIVEEVEILDHEIDPRGPPDADRVLPRKDSVENNREHSHPEGLEDVERREHVPQLIDLGRKKPSSGELSLQQRTTVRLLFLGLRMFNTNMFKMSEAKCSIAATLTLCLQSEVQHKRTKIENPNFFCIHGPAPATNART